MRMFSVPGLCLLIGLTAWDAPAWGAKGFSGRFRSVSAKHLAVQPQEGEFYGEEYEFFATNESGERLSVSFKISNLGFGDMHGEVSIGYRDAAGKHTKASRRYDDDEWSHTASPFSLSMGKNRISGSPERLEVHLDEQGIVGTLKVINTLPAWRPGNGRATYKDGGFVDLTLLAPRATFDARFVAAGNSVTFKGDGYADHRISNVAPHEAGRRWLKFRATDKDWTLIFQEFYFPRDQGGRRVPFLLVGHQGQIVFQSLNYRLKFEEAGRDRNPETPYRYPKRMRLTAKQSGRTFSADIVGSHMRRKDLLESLGSVERAILSKIIHPVAYYFRAQYTGRLDAGDAGTWELGGKGTYDVKHVSR